MRKCVQALAAIFSLTATPALAAPCKTAGDANAPIAFPTGTMADVQLARSMVFAMMPDVTGAPPKTLDCTRLKLATVVGDYTLGGENGDPSPRVAFPAEGKANPLIYLAASPQAPGKFALVLYRKNAPIVVKRFYTGVPTDERLADDIRAALADHANIMSFDPSRKMVLYGFSPPGDVPPPVESGSTANGKVVAGPQFLIANTGDIRTLDSEHNHKHKPTGFTCPQTFAGLAVLLMSIDPRSTDLVCTYRARTDLHFRPDDEVRYQLVLTLPQPGETPRSVFDQLVASARTKLRIKGDHIPPIATGQASGAQFVAYWDTEDAGVQGAWVGKAGRYIVWLRVTYPSSPDNDAEAGKVAQILFDLVSTQVK